MKYSRMPVYLLSPLFLLLASAATYAQSDIRIPSYADTVTRSNPALAVRDGRFFVAWEEPGTYGKFMFGESWFAEDRPFRPIDSLLFDLTPWNPDVNSMQTQQYAEILPVEHAVVVAYRRATKTGSKETVWYHRTHTLRYGTPQGMKAVTGEKVSSNNYYWAPVYDPLMNQTVVAGSESNQSHTQIFALDEQGNRAWADSVPMIYGENHPIAILPHMFYLYNPGGGTPIRRYVHGEEITSVELPGVDHMQVGRYRTLKDGHILRTYMAQPRVWPVPFQTPPVLADSLVVFEVYDAGGNLLAADTIQAPTRYYDFTLTQAPDGAIIIFWGSDNGIRMTVMSHNLTMRERDVQISATTGKALKPAIGYHDGKLHVVWEDYRNRHPDIYGTTWSLLQWLSDVQADDDNSVGTGGTGLEIARITPNPVRGEASITIESARPGTITIEVIDMLGRVVGWERREGVMSGTQSLEFDLHGLAPGVYMMALEGADGSRAAGRIIVSR